MPRTVTDLLRLLAEDAPAAELERAARELAAVDPAAGTDARELVLRIRAGIDERRRREAELSALVDTARDLASRPEPGGVLDAIVRRARSLLGTDVAYLTLHDPARGDTFMRATAGSVSARFQSLRLPLGAGLGGKVAQTRLPYWTADYPADARYRHTTEIDAAVGEEGLVAICGTPLLLDGAFVGVLFAANRARRPFGHDEVALLGSLAALAAVSLVQARQLAETAQALAELRTAHSAIAEAAAAHDRFAGVVLDGGDVADLAAALGELFGCWVVVLDADGRRSAEHGDPPPAGSGPDPLAASAAARVSATTRRLAGADGVWAAVVDAAGQQLGTLLVGGPVTLDAGQGRTVERAAMVTALVLLFRLRAAEADQRVRTDLLAELITDDPARLDRTVAERARLLGVGLRAPHVVAVCRCPAGHRRRVAMAAADAVGRSGLAGEHGGSVVVLLPGDDPSAIAGELARRLAGSGPGEDAVTVGAAGPVVPADGLAAAHAEARRSADALLALGRRGQGAAAPDLGFAGLLLSDERDVPGFVRRTLGPVLDHDATRGSDLLATLEGYFAAGASPRRAAAALHVHPNTVVQRLERVGALLGADWQDPARALQLQLALHLHRLGAD